MLVNWMKYLFGGVGFEASEGFLDRFINLCWNRRIPLWNLTREGDTLKADTSVKGYKRMRAAAKKSAVKLRVTEKKGLPFLIRHNRMRAGALVGAALALIFVLFAVSSVWQISVRGNENVSAYRVVALAEEAGLKRAMPKKNIDRDAVRLQIMENVPSVSWCAVNVRGGTVEIELRENENAPEVYETATPVNIVAAKDGYVELMNILRGEAAVGNGEAVVKGQLLISGVIDRVDGTFYTVHAKGECFAQTTETVTVKADAADYYALSDLRVQRRVYIFGAQLPLGRTCSREKTAVSERDLGSDAFLLPLGLITKTAFNTVGAASVPEDVLELLTAAAFHDRYAALMQRCEIQATAFSLTDGEMTLRAQCRENIAVEQPIIMDLQ